MKTVKFSLILVIISISIISCDQDIVDASIDDRPSVATERSIDVNYVELSYDAHSVTYVKDKTELSELDQIASHPLIESDHIEMKISNDGSSRIETVKIPSEFPSLPGHNVLPSDRPEVVKTIYENEVITLIDIEDNVIRENQVPQLDFSYMIPMINDAIENMGDITLNDLLACIRSNVDMKEVEKLIESPPPGTTIVPRNGFYTIHSSIDPPFDPGQNNVYSGYTVIHAVNIDQNMYLGSTLYDAGGNVVTSTQFVYDNCDLIGMVTDFQEVLPSGQEVLMSTNTHFSNLIMNIL